MRMFRDFSLAALALFGSFLAVQALESGKKAPNFTGQDSLGVERKLSDFKGKTVVLEWTNPECPFVKAHYQKGKMQRLQAKWAKKGVVWLRVVSSAPGKQGFMTKAECQGEVQKDKVQATATILDPTGAIGTLYGAKTTPHMFVIDPKGNLLYMGAIDNAPREEDEVKKGDDGSPFVNYVDQALTQSLAGKTVSVPSTVPYGCGVKYKD